jgi:hypothetical protein
MLNKVQTIRIQVLDSICILHVHTRIIGPAIGRCEKVPCEIVPWKEFFGNSSPAKNFTGENLSGEIVSNK